MNRMRIIQKSSKGFFSKIWEGVKEKKSTKCLGDFGFAHSHPDHCSRRIISVYLKYF